MPGEFDLAGLTRPEIPPAKNVALQKGDYFAYLAQHDLLLALPYQSINPFVDLLYEAADDPDVVSIKITLYRLAGSSRIAAALAYAAAHGEQVAGVEAVTPAEGRNAGLEEAQAVAAPADVEGRDVAPFLVRDKDGLAVGGLDEQADAGLVRGKAVPFGKGGRLREPLPRR